MSVDPKNIDPDALAFIIWLGIAAGWTVAWFVLGWCARMLYVEFIVGGVM